MSVLAQVDAGSVTTAVGLLFSLLGVVAISKKAVDFVAWIRNGNWDAVIKTIVAIAVAIGITFVLRETDFAGGISVLDRTLDQMNNWTIAYIGLALGAIAAWGYDWMKAKDNTGNAVTEPIIYPSANQVVVEPVVTTTTTRP